jgi:hypothetical protein
VPASVLVPALDRARALSGGGGDSGVSPTPPLPSHPSTRPDGSERTKYEIEAEAAARARGRGHALEHPLSLPPLDHAEAKRTMLKCGIPPWEIIW